MKTCAGNGYPICEVQVICWTFGVPGNVILNPSSRETNSVQSSCANADPASARTHAVATRTVTRIVLLHLTVSGRDYMRTGRAGPLLLCRGSVVRWFGGSRFRGSRFGSPCASWSGLEPVAESDRD